MKSKDIYMYINNDICNLKVTDCLVEIFLRRLIDEYFLHLVIETYKNKFPPQNEIFNFFLKKKQSYR